jgi:hypothetical protein
VRLQERGTVIFSATIDGAVYARHGTTIETRLTVIDKRAAEHPAAFPASPGTAPDTATLLGWISERVLPVSGRASRSCDRGAHGNHPAGRCCARRVLPFELTLRRARQPSQIAEGLHRLDCQ